jgi:hypothetical protein
MLNVIMLNVIMLNVIMLNVIMQSFIMLNVVMLSVSVPLFLMTGWRYKTNKSIRLEKGIPLFHGRNWCLVIPSKNVWPTDIWSTK